jgi:3-deoxy-D-manno-octulosonic-acid transferase
MAGASMDKVFSSIYQLVWWAAIPFLRHHHRLADGYAHRCLTDSHLTRADLWIQSASAGEVYLAWEILKRLPDEPPLRVLATTNTRQGMGILQQAIQDLSESGSNMEIQASYFPFDSPVIMKKVIRLVRPRLMVLMETELWPALLSGLKQAQCPVLLLNGRLTPKSFDRYMIWPSFWRRRKPAIIRAISTGDRDRLAALFDDPSVATMPNIKFDRLTNDDSSSAPLASLMKWLPSHQPFLILGSVREAEEAHVENIIQYLLKRHPDTVIGLFPRHMHRVHHWQKALQRLGIRWTLRSGAPLNKGGVVVWDVFGELGLAYPLASAAFVGGSLVSLGGQNFLEPLVKGVPTIIGPFWDNFKWVGQEILDRGVLHQADTWKQVAEFLVAGIINPAEKKRVKNKALDYIRVRQGGTHVACGLINTYLASVPTNVSK